MPLCAYTFIGLAALSFIPLTSCLLPESPQSAHIAVHTMEGLSPFLNAGGCSLSQPPCHPAVVVAMGDASAVHVSEGQIQGWP